VPLTNSERKQKVETIILKIPFAGRQNAMKLSPEAGRESAMDAGLRQAINVPLNLAKHVDTVWDTLVQMAAVGNINCKSDLQVFFKKQKSGANL
jgi:formiminotetrahydrofolate cyclodeaminase